MEAASSSTRGSCGAPSGPASSPGSSKPPRAAKPTPGDAGHCQGRHLNMLLGRSGSGGSGGSGGSQAAVARCRGDKLETGLERGVGYRSSVVRMARSYAGCLCCSASSADHAEMRGGMWGARLPESAATLSPKAAFPTASLEADPKTLAGDALGRAVWGGLVELRLEVCRGTRSVAQPAACSVSIFGSSVEPREERRDLQASAPPVSMVKRSVAQQRRAGN